VEYVWYTHPTGFGLWKRWTEDGTKKERPLYLQQQQAQWITEEVRTSDSFDAEQLRDKFLECLKALSMEIDAASSSKHSDSLVISEYRKDLHQDLDFKEKKIVGELMHYFGKDSLEPTQEMLDLLNYASQNATIDPEGAQE